MIYKFALDKLPKEQAEDVLRAYTVHQKRFGDRRALESAVYNKRKVKYEAEINENPHNYDTWFDYARLLEEEAAAFAVPDAKQPAAQAAVKQPYSKVDSLEAARQQAVEAVRELYERAIAQVPPIKEKRYWRRYIYLWIYYAVFEELVTADIDRARQVWETCLKVLYKIARSIMCTLLYCTSKVYALSSNRLDSVFNQLCIHTNILYSI